MTHFVEICQYNHTHGQCRCASRVKTIRRVECTMPDIHGIGQSRRDLLEDMNHALALYLDRATEQRATGLAEAVGAYLTYLNNGRK